MIVCLLFCDDVLPENGVIHSAAFRPLDFSDDAAKVRNPFFILARVILRP